MYIYVKFHPSTFCVRSTWSTYISSIYHLYLRVNQRDMVDFIMKCIIEFGSDSLEIQATLKVELFSWGDNIRFLYRYTGCWQDIVYNDNTTQTE